MEKQTKNSQKVDEVDALRRATLHTCLLITDESIHSYAAQAKLELITQKRTRDETEASLVAALREYRRLVHTWRRHYHEDPPGFQSPTKWDVTAQKGR